MSHIKLSLFRSLYRKHDFKILIAKIPTFQKVNFGLCSVSILDHIPYIPIDFVFCTSLAGGGKDKVIKKQT